MSYDLFFCRPKRMPFVFEEVVEWCKQFPQFKKTSETQLWYHNEHTGVYFSIDYDGKVSPDESQIPADFQDLGLSFNLNFVRPHFFALEAMPVIERLQSTFSFLTVNPQAKDCDHPIFFSSAELIENWSEGNESAIGFFEKERGMNPLYSISREMSLAAWKYNHVRLDVERAAEHAAAFVPHVFFFRKLESSKAGTMFTWSQGIPTLVPSTDWVGIVRKRRKLFGTTVQEVGFVHGNSLFAKMKHLLNEFEIDFKTGVQLYLLPETNVAAANRILQFVKFDLHKIECEVVSADRLREKPAIS